MQLPDPARLNVSTLGPGRYRSPLAERERCINDEHRILACASTEDLERCTSGGAEPPSFEAAGPRSELFFDPQRTTCALVTCGGLCPGLNNVIRSIVLALYHGYGVRRILGFRYGYDGLSDQAQRQPFELAPGIVENLPFHGGSRLGTSRGPHPPDVMVRKLGEHGVDILFAIGGDGTMRGARALCEEVERQGLEISIVGVPKTIDNDLRWVERSFGFATAVEEARSVITAAHAEARSVWNGVGVVKLMGRHSGFIAAYAALASGHANFCLVPEVDLILDGPGGLLEALERRLNDRHHAVIVVAEGAGQALLAPPSAPERRDISGNVELRDIGLHLCDAIRGHFGERGIAVDLKYLDPSYNIRSQPANTLDAGFGLVLGQHAVHAGMAGRTSMMVGLWNSRFTHVPLSLVTEGRKQLDPQGEIWQRVLEATGQPATFGA